MNDKTGPVFDRKHAMEITNGDTEFLKKLVGIFESDHPEKLDGISISSKGKGFQCP